MRQYTVQPFERGSCSHYREQRRGLLSKALLTLLQQVHAKLAFMSVTAIDRPLSNFSVPGNLVHADSLDAMLSEEPPRSLQDALAMLRGIAPFMPPVGLEQPWYARRPWAIMNFVSHNCSLLTSGHLSGTIYIWTTVHLDCSTL